MNQQTSLLFEDSNTDSYTCTKSGKNIKKINPECPTPATYCKFRTSCIIYELYKDKLKKQKIKK